MNIPATDIHKALEALRQQREQARTQLIACDGAIQVLEQLLSKSGQTASGQAESANALSLGEATPAEIERLRQGTE